MQTSVFENYLRDLGHILKSEALEAVAKRDAAAESERPFLEGISLGYVNVLSLMLSQAKVFGITPEQLNLENIDPDRLH